MILFNDSTTKGFFEEKLENITIEVLERWVTISQQFIFFSSVFSKEITSARLN